jgi:hypothetical protein
MWIDEAHNLIDRGRIAANGRQPQGRPSVDQASPDV